MEKEETIVEMLDRSLRLAAEIEMMLAGLADLIKVGQKKPISTKNEDRLRLGGFVSSKFSITEEKN